MNFLINLVPLYDTFSKAVLKGRPIDTYSVSIYGRSTEGLMLRFLKSSGLNVIKREFIIKHKIKRNDWLLADTCPQAANHCALF